MGIFLVMEIEFYATPSGRSPALDFLRALPERERAAIMSDLQAITVDGDRAPVSRRTIKGHAPMWELKTWGFRAFCIGHRGTLWVLHVCKKQDQRHGIELAAKRMKEVLEEA